MLLILFAADRKTQSILSIVKNVLLGISTLPTSFILFFSLFLFVEKLSLSEYLAVTFHSNILSHCGDVFPCDNISAYGKPV